jgi:hypothetical protein
VQLRAPGALHAVDRPHAAVLGEVRRVRRVPVLRVHDERPGGPCGPDLVVDRGDHALAPRHVQAALRVREVVLDVDDDERGPCVIGELHAPTLFRLLR